MQRPCPPEPGSPAPWGQNCADGAWRWCSSDDVQCGTNQEASCTGRPGCAQSDFCLLRGSFEQRPYPTNVQDEDTAADARGLTPTEFGAEDAQGAEDEAEEEAEEEEEKEDDEDEDDEEEDENEEEDKEAAEDAGPDAAEEGEEHEVEEEDEDDADPATVH